MGKEAAGFRSGTKWQYSNTNYVIAGVIIEKVSGTALIEFLHKNVFVPLGMDRVADTDDGRLVPPDPAGYMRYALGPSRPAPKEGRGWMFAAGELAMPAEDLAKWDISIMDQKLLKSESYRQFETEVVLKNGVGTQYALGMFVKDDGKRRELEHNGEVSGFTGENIVYPDDKVAIVVLTNQDATSAGGQIAHGISPLLFETSDAATPQKLEAARKIFEALQKGQIDRLLFTSNTNSYFNDQALQDFASSLGPLGVPEEFVQVRQELRGGMMLRVYRVKFPQKTVRVWTYEMPDGKLEQYQVAAVN